MLHTWDENASPHIVSDSEWAKMSNEFANAGYREGITAGKESALQFTRRLRQCYMVGSNTPPPPAPDQNAPRPLKKPIWNLFLDYIKGKPSKHARLKREPPCGWRFF
ncbi:hypothetical protein E1B28_003283 [Marasmius oreades]|uniref:Uncharacterized protein n=1 Tax=Marasmius oreades TaxID=181124 RepID=A0A9P7RLM9_9AGAR|nr:uncharacterized protein E1B28_003283 [Marasmius oreades]KAG7085740.1 hypothetical protein E1B28_003283 [Marasmius oreades]